MMQRSRPTKDVSMGRQSGRSMSECFGEHHAFFGKFINIRRLQMFGTVATQPVNPESIDRDEKNIQFGGFFSRVCVDGIYKKKANHNETNRGKNSWREPFFHFIYDK